LTSGYLERNGGVALLTIATELTEVHVLLLMTGGAVGGKPGEACCALMTLTAADSYVCACQRKAGPRVIELPELPTGGRVAIGTVLTHRASMHITGGVTAVTISSGLREVESRMATGTGHHRVLAHQRVGGEVVIEPRGRLPSIAAMAALTFPD
jgi:hypothetical protein